MVSHAETVEPARRAPSIGSRSGRSRNQQHHQRGRSHHGGTSYAPQNDFPFFAQTGDVEIVIECDGQEKRYLLHRLILAQSSGSFAAGMSDEWSRTQALRELHQRSERRPEQQLSVIGEEASSSEVSASLITSEQASRAVSGRRRWRYELNWDEIQEDEEPILIQQPPKGSTFTPSPMPPPLQQPRPKPPASQSFFRSMANLNISSHPGHASQSVANLSMPMDPALANPLLRDYDNLFRIFYNYPPILNITNIASAYSECKSLLTIADMYDALPVVGHRVEHHLLAFSSRLFKQIAKYPPSYLKLGYLARSRVIFSEALTHVVGQWPQAFPYLKPTDPPSNYEVPIEVMDLIEDKVEELEEMKSKVESKLFRLTLTTSRGERVNPSNDYLGWLAMSLFRQWIAENTTPEVRGILKNGPGSRPSSRNTTGPNATTVNLPAQAQQRPGQDHTGPMSIPQPPPPQPDIGRLVRLIASTNTQAYLSHEELKRFLKLHPSSSTSSSGALYTKESLKRFERKMDQLKNIARDIVKPLTRNCLELDVRALGDGQGGGLGYLTCMKMEDNEVPWEQQQPQQQYHRH